MKNTDILVIGGSATGLVAAMTAKSNHPDKSVTIVRKEEKVMIPCGIPYIFGTTGSTDNNVIPDGGLVNLGVAILVDTVTKVNHKEKIAELASGETIKWDKLILGTGSQPRIPGWLKGADLEGVFTIAKNHLYLDELQRKLSNKKRIVVVGAGFIGIEVSDELNKSGKQVTLIEILPTVLGATFDPEFGQAAQDQLVERGVTVKTNLGIKAINGTDCVKSVTYSDGSTEEADAVILSLGYGPNAELAKSMGIELNEYGFIKADQYRRTSLPDVFAAGDCAEKVDFATGKLSTIMLASTACNEARIAALNLYKLNTVSVFKGTLGIYSTCIGDTAYAVAGLIEKEARREGFRVVADTFTGINRHPGKLAGAHKETVKLIVSECGGAILGGEVMGGVEVGQLINVIGLAIQNNMTIHQLIMTQIGSHPMLSASPAGFPLIKAAEKVAGSLRKCHS